MRPKGEDKAIGALKAVARSAMTTALEYIDIMLMFSLNYIYECIHAAMPHSWSHEAAEDAVVLEVQAHSIAESDHIIE